MSAGYAVYINFNLKQICTALQGLALHKEIKLTRREQQFPLIKHILTLPFDDEAERRLFCLEMLLLVQDPHFPMVWNQANLELLRQLQVPYLPISGLEDLLIPMALQAQKGRSFHPVLLELLSHLRSVPDEGLHWTILLQFVQKAVPFEDIAALFNSRHFESLSAQKLHQLLKFDIVQLNVLTYTLNQFEKGCGLRFDLVFYLLQHTTLVTERIEVAGAMICRFISEVLSIAEQRVNGFGQTYFRKGPAREVEQGYQRVLALFFFWQLHRDPEGSYGFFEAPLALSDNEVQKAEAIVSFRKTPFAEAIRYLPDFCLWELGLVAQQNLELLIHLAAGQNVRTFPGLRLPIPKKVAHAFHQLQPGDLPVFRHLNDVIFQLYGRYLQMDGNIMQVVTNYYSFAWVNLHNRGFRFGSVAKNRVKFLFWDSVLKKWAAWFAADPTYDGLTTEEIWLTFGYIQHTLDEKESLPLKGATARSLHRRALKWRQDIQEKMDARDQATAYWPGAAYIPYSKEIEGIVYQIVQLTTAEGLREEGNLMRHCVLSYRHKCAKGECSIWSLRKMEEGKLTSLVTMEINERHQMVQVRGACNQAPGKFYRTIIKEWALREEIWGG